MSDRIPLFEIVIIYTNGASPTTIKGICIYRLFTKNFRIFYPKRTTLFSLPSRKRPRKLIKANSILLLYRSLYQTFIPYCTQRKNDELFHEYFFSAWINFHFQNDAVNFCIGCTNGKHFSRNADVCYWLFSNNITLLTLQYKHCFISILFVMNLFWVWWF